MAKSWEVSADGPAWDALLAKADNEPDTARRAGYLAEAKRIMLTTRPSPPSICT